MLLYTAPFRRDLNWWSDCCMGVAGAWGCNHARAQVEEEAVSPGRGHAAELGPH